MERIEEKQLLEEVVEALKERGYEPWEQIKGFVDMGEESYITRHNGAREKIKQVSPKLLKEELQKRGLYENKR